MCVNRISEILENKGFTNVRPTDNQLHDMGITLHTWNKWVRKKSDPEMIHMKAIAEFLSCSIDELIVQKEVAA